MLHLRSMTLQDIERVARVATQAFVTSRSFQPRLKRYLEIQPDGWMVAEEDGVIIGSVGAIGYGTFGYLGLLSVDPAQQGRGLGRRLLQAALEALQRRGIEGAVLDASDAGRRLYEKMGFEACGPSIELELELSPSSHVPQHATASRTDAGSIRVTEIGAAAAYGLVTSVVAASDVAASDVAASEVGHSDFAALAALDGALFGADRARVWRSLLDEPTMRTWLARTPEGEAVGYLCAQEQQLGPWGARTPAAATALLAETLAVLAPRTWRVQLPGDNVAGRDLLLSLGFLERRSLLHMRRGPCPPLSGWRSLYGKGSYCLG